MNENIKLQNKLKNLETKDDKELIPVKLTVEQAKKMLMEGNGETSYNKIFDVILKSKEELQKSVNEQFKKTEMQKYKEQFKKYMDNIFTTIDHLEEYTYFYVDGAIEKQEDKMNSLEEKIIELVIVKDELDKTQVLNKELNEKNKELESRHNKVIKERDDLEKEYEDTKGMLDDKEKELDDVNKQLTTATSQVNDLLLSHKKEVDKLVDDLDKEQRRRVESEQKAYEISLKEEGYKIRINEKDAEIKDYRNKFNEQISKNQELMNNLRKEKDEKIEELHSKNNALSLLVNNLKEEKTKLEEVVGTQKTEIETIKDEKNKLEVEKTNLEDIKNKNEGIIKEQEGIIKEQKGALKTANEKYETDINKAKEDAENEKQQALEGLANSHKEEQEKLKKQIADLQVDLKKQIADLQVDLKVKNELNGKLEEEAKKVPGLKNDLTITKGKLDAVIEERNKFEKMYKDLMTKFTELATTKN